MHFSNKLKIKHNTTHKSHETNKCTYTSKLEEPRHRINYACDWGKPKFRACVAYNSIVQIYRKILNGEARCFASIVWFLLLFRFGSNHFYTWICRYKPKIFRWLLLQRWTKRFCQWPYKTLCGIAFNLPLPYIWRFHKDPGILTVSIPWKHGFYS